jgi:hypothetical protein
MYPKASILFTAAIIPREVYPTGNFRSADYNLWYPNKNDGLPQRAALRQVVELAS